MWIQKILTHLEDRFRKVKIFCNKYSRSIKKIASTVLMVFVSLLPYTDIFLDFFIDTKSIKVGRFPNLSAAIWSYSVCITPLLVLAVSKLRPWWGVYIVTIYVNVVMLLGFLFLDYNINIKSDWVFRGIALGLSFVLLILCKYLSKYFKVLVIEDEIDFEIKKLEKLNHDDQKTT